MKSPLARMRMTAQPTEPPPLLRLVPSAGDIDPSLLTLLGDEAEDGGGLSILTSAHDASSAPVEVLRLLEDDRGAGDRRGSSIRLGVDPRTFLAPEEDSAHDADADVEPPPDPEPPPPPPSRPSPEPPESDASEPSDVPEESAPPEEDEPVAEGTPEPSASSAPIAETPGVLKLRIGSRHARVFVGGAFVPSAVGLAELELAPGTYPLEVQAPGKVTLRGTIRVAAGKVTNVVVPLKPKGQWAPFLVGVAMMGAAYVLWKSGISVYEEAEPSEAAADLPAERGRRARA